MNNRVTKPQFCREREKETSSKLSQEKESFGKLVVKLEDDHEKKKWKRNFATAVQEGRRFFSNDEKWKVILPLGMEKKQTSKESPQRKQQTSHQLPSQGELCRVLSYQDSGGE